MTNKYRVIRAYLSKVSAWPVEITDKQASEIEDILKNDPYKLKSYVGNNNIDVNGYEYTLILLEHVKSKSLAHLYLKAGLAPMAVELAERRIGNSSAKASFYLKSGWLTPEVPAVKRAFLYDINPYNIAVFGIFLSAAAMYIEKGWLNPEDAEVKKVLLVAVRKFRPKYADALIDKGWLTQAEVDKALGR